MSTSATSIERSEAGSVAGPEEPREPRLVLLALTYLLSFPLFPLQLFLGHGQAYYVWLPWHAILTVALILGLGWSRRRLRSLASLPRLPLALGAVLLLAAAVPRGPAGAQRLLGRQDLLELLYGLGTLVLMGLGWTERARGRALGLLGILGGLTAVLILVDRVFDTSPWVPPVGNSPGAALLLLAALPAAALGPGGGRAVVLTLLILAGLALTGSWGVAVAVAAGALGLALGSRAGLARLVRGLAALALVAALLLAGREVLTTPRVELWRGSLAMVAEHPLVGVGGGRFQVEFPSYRPGTYYQKGGRVDVSTDPQSHWLRVAAEGGVLGLVVWIALLASLARAFRQGPGDPLARAAGLAALLLLLQGSFDQTLGVPHGRTWLFLLLGLAVSARAPGPEAGESPLASPALRWAVRSACLATALAIGHQQVYRPVAASASYYRATRESQDPELVVERLARAVELAPWEPRYAWHYALNVSDLVGAREGLKAFELVRELAPDYGHLHLNLGLLHERLGEHEAAAREFRRELKLYPGHPEAVAGLVRAEKVAPPSGQRL